MKRLFAVVAVLIVSFPAMVFAQWISPHQAGYPPYGFRVFTDWRQSNVRLDVSPGDARVFVDKEYAGTVDEFSGTFQRLTLPGGPHLVEVRKPGFKSLAIELNLFPDQTITLSQALSPSRGDDESADQEAIAPALEEGAFLPSTDAPSGDLRFDVKPKDAAIYADGFYVGLVNDFNGSQHMMLTQGTHHLVLKRQGYETLDLTLSIDSERPVTYRAVMKKLTPGS